MEAPPAAAALEPADRIAARLLPIGEKVFLTRGLLRLPADRVSDLVNDIRSKRREFRRWIGREAEDRGCTLAELEAIVPVDHALLGELAPIFTRLWLSAALEPRFEARRSQPPASERAALAGADRR